LRKAAFAVCLVVAVGVHAYRLGIRAQGRCQLILGAPDDRLQKLAPKEVGGRTSCCQAARLAQLQEQSSTEERELAKIAIGVARDGRAFE